MFSFEVWVCMNRKGCGTGWGSVGTLEVWQVSVCWASRWTEALSFERLLFLAPKVISYLFSMLRFLNLELFYIMFLWWKFYTLSNSFGTLLFICEIMSFIIIKIKNGWCSLYPWIIKSCFKNSGITNLVHLMLVDWAIWYWQFTRPFITSGSDATE